jgi:hypothetical protein
MEFRLTYEGPLRSDTCRTDRVRAARRKEKQEIRKQLHPQLKRWWEISPFLALGKTQPNRSGGPVRYGYPYEKHGIDALAQRFAFNGYHFVPLVIRDLELFCNIDVLLLRLGSARSVLQHSDSSGGDIDNRFKVLFDALSIPRDAAHLGPYVQPDQDEKPFFVLLEDDSVITKATIESDFLLKPVSDRSDPSDVRVIITVKIRPIRLLVENAGFA